MLFKTRRFLSLTLCMGTLSLLFVGCSEKVSVETETKSLEKEVTSLETVPTRENLELEIKFNHLSFISHEGMEIGLDAALFQEKWVELTEYLQLSSNIALQDPFTLVAWDKENQPYVIQIAPAGIKIGQDFYRSEKKLEPLIDWIREHIGDEYLNNLSMERIIIEARDLDIKKELSSQMAEDVYQLLKSSVLVKGEPRILTPLYPHYLLDVEYKKDQFLQFVVLSPTLLAINDGQNKWFYQLNNSMFSLLKEIIPITHFSEHHIKFLFQAEEIIIEDGEHTYVINKDQTEGLVLETLVHQYARMFAQGRKTTKTNLPIEEDAEIHFRVQFNFVNSLPKHITVYDDFFYFDEERYELANISNKIWDMIDSTNAHK